MFQLQVHNNYWMPTHHEPSVYVCSSLPNQKNDVVGLESVRGKVFKYSVAGVLRLFQVSVLSTSTVPGTRVLLATSSTAVENHAKYNSVLPGGNTGYRGYRSSVLMYHQYLL
jgi:hypothetical protein